MLSIVVPLNAVVSPLIFPDTFLSDVLRVLCPGNKCEIGSQCSSTSRLATSTCCFCAAFADGCVNQHI